MISRPLISVVMPVYNAGSFVSEAIDSILNQSFGDFELIIMNDGSTDDSEKIIKTFADERIVYIKNSENLGVIKGPNILMGMARGKYIARMDADDIAMPSRLEEQLRIFTENDNAVLVASDYYAMSGNKLTYVKNFNRSDELKATLLFGPCFAHPTVMFKNIWMEKNLFYDENFRYAEDYKLWTDISFLGDFCNVAKPLLKYRSSPAQMSVIHGHTQKESSEKIRKLYLRKRGFVFSDEDLATHQIIGNNVFIRSVGELSAIEKWLSKLIKQNEKLNAFETRQFYLVINKFWQDSCGFSSLGLKAFREYFKSEISKGAKISFSQKIKLLGKCIIRRFR